MGSGTLTLAFNYPARGGRPAVREMLVVPMVANVERSVNVNLTEMPTLIYGYRNNFCMDLGATEKVTFKCERNNPSNYSDSSTDPARWSNGKWYRHLEDLFDRWQNFGLNSSGEQTGGCTMSFEPEDETLIAPISGNAFLVGALSPDYSVQKMTFSLSMQLANMKPGASRTIEYVTLTLVTTDDSGATHRSTLSVLKNYPQTIPLPSGWEEFRVGSAFMGWRMGSITIASNTAYTFSTDATLTAIWNSPFSCDFCTSDAVLTVPSGVNYLKAYIVGGGGGGGGSRTRTRNSSSIAADLIGGGGGAGEAVVREAFVDPGDTVTIICGSGGSNGRNSTTSSIGQSSVSDGGDGGATTVRISDGTSWSAQGGQGGKACNISQRLHGDGGSQYVRGGTHGSGYSGGRSGGYSSPNISENAGKGGKDDESAEEMGGNGGGAAAFRYRFTLTDGTIVPSSTEWYESKGGSGKDVVDGTDPTDGVHGGGGGSGMRDGASSGKGGSGCAIVLMFKNVII